MTPHWDPTLTPHWDPTLQASGAAVPLDDPEEEGAALGDLRSTLSGDFRSTLSGWDGLSGLSGLVGATGGAAEAPKPEAHPQEGLDSFLREHAFKVTPRRDPTLTHPDRGTPLTPQRVDAPSRGARRARSSSG